ncbi:hypothetical protein NDU88_005151 [Pleurodeles waltl]|uniref:Uncharacterized protein n=1 Tax=Pleurodeles waltl TaxID=8319 RepID=A0AAV7MZM7_PLEWA|nr:hypothetical protein NDU88_005151 [Pleurodeles waltl]
MAGGVCSHQSTLGFRARSDGKPPDYARRAVVRPRAICIIYGGSLHADRKLCALLTFIQTSTVGRAPRVHLRAFFSRKLTAANSPPPPCLAPIPPV